MARKPKTGLEYYSVDTNIFQNRKIKRLIRTFGAKGYMIYSYLITEIYRDKGCFLEWDENTAFDVSDYLNESENLVEEVVGYCCNVGLFNKELRTSENVLTTKNIQEFWVKVSKQAKRKFCDVDVRYSLIKEESTVNKEESTLNREFKTVKREESTQSKVKESKLTPLPPLSEDYDSSNFLKNWNELRSHYLKTPSNLNKLYLEDEDLFNARRNDFTKEQWQTALRGLFKQEKMPRKVMHFKPRHFLENVEQYLDAELNKEYKLYA